MSLHGITRPFQLADGTVGGGSTVPIPIFDGAVFVITTIGLHVAGDTTTAIWVSINSGILAGVTPVTFINPAPAPTLFTLDGFRTVSGLEVPVTDADAVNVTCIGSGNGDFVISGHWWSAGE